MIFPILCLPAISFIISWLATLVIRGLTPRIGFVDKPGGRKIHANPKPLGGGIAIFAGFAIPLLAALALVFSLAPNGSGAHWNPAYIRGAREHTPLALGMIGAMLLMHLLGLADDRRSLGPFFKLLVQLLIVGLFVILFDCRALTTLDHLGLGRWPSVIVTMLWITG